MGAFVEKTSSIFNFSRKYSGIDLSNSWGLCKSAPGIGVSGRLVAQDFKAMPMKINFRFSSYLGENPGWIISIVQTENLLLENAPDKGHRTPINQMT
jgi:hypothetical protein